MGAPYDEVRYRKGRSLVMMNVISLIRNFLSVLKQCALERDLSLWEAGDRTEVGEKGLTLRYVIATPAPYIAF